jgi:DNA-binding NtrC family response regulator
LQENEVEPVGARRSVKVDVRIMSATNRNLIADVKAGRFREDLFYRLHVFPISVPPLRERREDIPDLIRHFLARFCAEEGKRIHQVSSEALTLLRQYRWPGNVRQLENAMFRAVVLADGNTLDVAEFPQIAAQVQAGETGAISAATEANDPEPQQPLRFISESPPLKADLTPASPITPAGTLSMVNALGDVRPLAELEADVIRFAISHCRGRMSEVARRLGIGRSTLYRKLEGLGLAATGEQRG